MRVLLVSVAVAVAALPAAAQGPTALDSIAVNVNTADFGVVGDGSDDCLLLDLGIPPTAGAQNFDLRLTACQGFPAGTLVNDNATSEKAAAYPQTNGGVAESALYADVNGNGRYDDGDLVYLSSGPGFPTSQTSGTWSVRLTRTPDALGGFAAGTLVFSSNLDYQAYASTATALPASVTWVDQDGTGAVFSPPDAAYLVPRAAGGLAAGALVPLGSILLHHDSAPNSESTTKTTTPSASSSSSAPDEEGESTAPDEEGESTVSESHPESNPGRQTPAAPVGGILLGIGWLASRRRSI